MGVVGEGVVTANAEVIVLIGRCRCSFRKNPPAYTHTSEFDYILCKFCVSMGSPRFLHVGLGLGLVIAFMRCGAKTEDTLPVLLTDSIRSFATCVCHQ